MTLYTRTDLGQAGSSYYSQYQKMKKEWRNTVYLARSKIQGLGLYASRDIEMNAMIIEYKGEVIRSEVGSIFIIFRGMFNSHLALSYLQSSQSYVSA